ncbi:GUN4 domain-containing protein [Pseudanabaena mucicola]|uniref:GUN4 domain-containing protein n=1 Tax=Pseudanabaena mucicola FACHB-723 TaxID=2692860 RepID=A0ABR7ZXN6_9CYAN|nr:GUN4 domain-containing protein [Pseudanabaena mucicola]MBD2188289.1 GUN4 domain-containing protein [Pseudanabaena mucicola FACHB-723]
MFIWSVLAAKVFEVGMTVIDDITGTIGQFFRTELFGEEATYQAEDENAIAIVLRNNSEAMQYFAEAQMQLAEVQQQQNELKKAELMINVALAEKERELKAQLSELWRDLKRELQQHELKSRQDLQVRQIQADWDKIKLPTIFSRQELENLAQDCDRPLFVCSKMQITEGCPDYFRTELVADAESQIKKFANLVFQGNVRFYSRFFDDENIFDANAAQLKSILPNVPCVMSFSKITRRKAYFHYQLWGSRSAEILKGNFDVELPWREVAQQIRDEASEAINDDDLYEIIGDWLTTLQKIYALFLVDLYAIVDGDDPFYSIKLDSVSFGVPEQTISQYIQPLAKILQRVQNERIEAFSEQLRRQKKEEKQKKRQEKIRLQQEESIRQEADRLANFKSECKKLDNLLASQQWEEADCLTKEIILQLANRTSQGFLNEESIANLREENLRSIDFLWLYHSRSKFGFSVQKKLFFEWGGKFNTYEHEVFQRFITHIGWDYEFLNNENIQKLPTAYFPRFVYDSSTVWRLVLLSLLSNKKF